jgi:hypothetical protein
MFLFSSTYSSAQQYITGNVKDSLRSVACEMNKADQQIRDSLYFAEQTGDQALILQFDKKRDSIDRSNFQVLENLIRSVGFPCPKLFGKGTCYPFDVLYHWSKEYPEWFNNPQITEYFKKEIENGHLPLPIMDMAHYLFVTFMEHDMATFQLINSARKLYGLNAYTKKQFLKKETIEPLLK